MRTTVKGGIEYMNFEMVFGRELNRSRSMAEAKSKVGQTGP